MFFASECSFQSARHQFELYLKTVCKEHSSKRNLKTETSKALGNALRIKLMKSVPCIATIISSVRRDEGLVTRF